MRLCFGHPLNPQEQTQLARSMASDAKKLKELALENKVIPIDKTLVIDGVTSRDKGMDRLIPYLIKFPFVQSQTQCTY